MTWNDLVRKYFPNANDEECEFILWERTAYPFANVEEVEKELQKMKGAKKHEN